MSERTPGPWHVNKFMDDEDDSYSIDDDMGQVAKTYCEGNAKLIAAAPDLLEALQGLHDDLMDYISRNNLGGENNHWMVRARQAIKKATE